MSLQVWLPLTGHTNNQGLSSFVFSNTATSMITVSSTGKLGQCYNFNSTATNSGIYSADNGFMATYINNHSWSMCAWVQTTATDTCVISLSYGLRMFAGSNTYVTLYNSSRTVSCYSSVNTTDGKWHHLIATYDVVSNKIQFYVDGICTATTNYTSGHTYASSWTNGLYIGKDPNNSTVSDHYLYKGKMNDVRIYDHALSAKEAHELSKALVLHYKLDDPYVESTTNLVPIPVDTGAANYAWDASLHVGARTVSGWGGGYNSGVGTPASGYHACWRIIENRPTMVYQNINSDYGMTGRWLGISSTACYPAINAGETYTISFEMMTVGKRQASFPYVFGGWYYKLTSSASSRSFHDGYFYLSNTKIGAWEKVSIVKTRASGFDNNTDSQAFYIYGQSSTEGIMYVRNVQVEKKDHATPYTGEAATSWNGTAVVYNSSGFGYNGTPANLATHTPSARYTNCVQFNGVDSRIVVPYNTVCPENIFTVNLWWKKDALGSKGYETLFGGPSGFEMDTRAGTNTTLCLYMAGVRGGTLYSPLSLGQWYMFTMVRDGTNEFYYINGELAKTIDAKPMPVGTYFIGAWSSPTSQNYYGQISDFRLYGTVLSAADVLELYHTEAAVGRGGEVFAREVVEQ